MKSLQIYGPFFTNYSYARVNRGLALSLNKIQDTYKISLYGDRERIDYFPTPEDLEKKPNLKELFVENNQTKDIIIYNNFPKSPSDLHGLADLKGKIKIAYIAWEESVYPKEWVKEINDNLHGVMVISSFIVDILKNSGVKIPIKSIPIALDEELRIKAHHKYHLDTKKNFKFLHISTAKKRKGIDILLKAYFEEFTNEDDVVLVLKTSPGPDNIVDHLINEMRAKNSPEILHITNSELTEEDLRNLHASADCEVYPTRAEGFGLPILEAMFQEVPVITTNYSGHLDFCNEENSYLIDYTLELASGSELVNIGAKWAEPDVKHLRSLMRYLFENRNSEEVKLKVKRAKETANKYTWDNTSRNAIEFIKEVEDLSELKKLNAATITPINDETGIAEYSKSLYSSIESSFKKFFYISNKDISDQIQKDEDNIKRLWSTGEESFEEVISFIKDNEIKFLHIQYHSGAFFSTKALEGLIKNLKDIDVKVFITFHAFRSNSFNYLTDVKNLELVDTIFIHNPNDYEYASKKLNNIEYFILPTLEFKKRNKSILRKNLGIKEGDFIISSHGLMNTNKNIPEIIKAVSKLKETRSNIKFYSINAVSSNNIHSTGIYDECRQIVEQNNMEDDVLFFPEFLDQHQIEILLQASDLIIFNYTEVGESASASIRKALASGNPVIVTDINMFSEFENEVLKIKDTTIESVYGGIKEIISNPELQKEITEKAMKFIQEHLYDNKAIQTLKVYKNTYNNL